MCPVHRDDGKFAKRAHPERAIGGSGGRGREVERRRERESERWNWGGWAGGEREEGMDWRD